MDQGPGPPSAGGPHVANGAERSSSSRLPGVRSASGGELPSGSREPAAPIEPHGKSPTGDPFRWTWGYYSTGQAARDAYNALYPDGLRSGIRGHIQEEGPETFRLDLIQTLDERKR